MTKQHEMRTCTANLAKVSVSSLCGWSPKDISTSWLETLKNIPRVVISGDHVVIFFRIKMLGEILLCNSTTVFHVVGAMTFSPSV